MALQVGYHSTADSHFLASNKAWHTLYLGGVVGTLSNMFLLHTFYQEKDIMASSVNVLICMDCMHRLLYSAFCVPWRNYNLITREPLFMDILGFKEISITSGVKESL